MPQPRSPPPIEQATETHPHLFAGQSSQYVLPLYLSAAQAGKNPVGLDGVDDIPPDDVPAIIQA